VLKLISFSISGSSSINLFQDVLTHPPFSTEVGGTQTEEEEPEDFLSHIIEVLNESFGSNLTDDDKIKLQKINNKLKENEELRKVHLSDNSENNKRYFFNKLFDKELLDLVKTDLDFYKNVSEPKRNEFIKNLMFEIYKKQIEIQTINSSL
jgi:type I restriction enzyme R subunit